MESNTIDADLLKQFENMKCRFKEIAPSAQCKGLGDMESFYEGLLVSNFKLCSYGEVFENKLQFIDEKGYSSKFLEATLSSLDILKETLKLNQNEELRLEEQIDNAKRESVRANFFEKNELFFKDFREIGAIALINDAEKLMNIIDEFNDPSEVKITESEMRELVQDLEETTKENEELMNIKNELLRLRNENEKIEAETRRIQVVNLELEAQLAQNEEYTILQEISSIEAKIKSIHDRKKTSISDVDSTVFKDPNHYPGLLNFFDTFYKMKKNIKCGDSITKQSTSKRKREQTGFCSQDNNDPTQSPKTQDKKKIKLAKRPSARNISLKRRNTSQDFMKQDYSLLRTSRNLMMDQRNVLRQKSFASQENIIPNVNFRRMTSKTFKDQNNIEHEIDEEGKISNPLQRFPSVCNINEEPTKNMNMPVDQMEVSTSGDKEELPINNQSESKMDHNEITTNENVSQEQDLTTTEQSIEVDTENVPLNFQYNTRSRLKSKSLTISSPKLSNRKRDSSQKKKNGKASSSLKTNIDINPSEEPKNVKKKEIETDDIIIIEEAIEMKNLVSGENTNMEVDDAQAVQQDVGEPMLEDLANLQVVDTAFEFNPNDEVIMDFESGNDSSSTDGLFDFDPSKSFENLAPSSPSGNSIFNNSFEALMQTNSGNFNSDGGEDFLNFGSNEEGDFFANAETNNDFF